MIHFLEPVYGIIFAFFFLHEIPSLRIILGGVIILWGQILIILRIFKKRKKDAHKI
jgi:drug/metabolite transporter (DMT)-like permease